MRISRASLGDTYGPVFIGNYPFISPVVLDDGRVIEHPGDVPATAEDCLPYNCGAFSANQPAKMWCSFWSHTHNRLSCIDPDCKPWRNLIPSCSLPAAFTAPPLPAATLPPLPPQPPPQIPTLTPANIVQPLPNVTLSLAPQPATIPSCDPWCVVNGWIDENPLLASAILAGAAYLLWPKGKR